MGSKEVLILQHVANENAGTILDFLKREKIPYRQVRLFEPGYELPPHSSVRALVVMGGPMNVYEEVLHPFLAEEDRYIREALRRGIPYLGVCLGSQLLAKALDAKVYKAEQEEIGWDDVKLERGAASDALLGPLGLEKLKVLQWHGDTFDLPKGAVHLASSGPVPNQAYSVDGRSWGLQFHVEVDRAMIEDWFKKREDLPKMLAEYDSYRQRLEALTDKMYRAFFSLS
jgi:GMP synthase (glutamine-hydrolysing)